MVTLLLSPDLHWYVWVGWFCHVDLNKGEHYVVTQFWYLWAALLELGWYQILPFTRQRNNMVKTDYLNQQYHQPAWLIKRETIMCCSNQDLSNLFLRPSATSNVGRLVQEKLKNAVLFLQVSVMFFEEAVMFKIKHRKAEFIQTACLQLSHWWEFFLPFTRQTKHWWKRIIWVTSCNICHPINFIWSCVELRTELNL